MGLACLVPFACLSATAQSAAAPAAKRTCNIRNAPMSPGDIALSHDNYDQAADLYRQESKAAGEEGERARSAMVRALLRADKVADAEKEAKAWLAQDPTGSWPLLTMSEVLRRTGNITDAIKTLQQAHDQDVCNPQVHLDWAWLLHFSDMDASAKHELDIAHSLAPVDDDVEAHWIRFQPRKTQIDELNSYLQRATFLSPSERHSLESWRDRLLQPPAAPCHIASPVTSATIPYRAIKDGPSAPTQWGLNVFFNGKQRRLQIDTGASGLVLTRSAAAALHLTSSVTGKSFGIGDEGDVQTEFAKVDSIKIGDLEFKDCDVEVIAPKNHEALSAEDGLIGGDVFSQFLLTLDFPGRVLKLDPLPAIPGVAQSTLSLTTSTAADDAPPRDRYVDPSMKDWTRVFGINSDLLIPIQLNQGPVHLFLIDTGSSLNLISPQAAREVAHVSRDDTFGVVGISGKVEKTYSTGPLALTFGHLHQPTEGMNSIDTSSISNASGAEVSGFLGAPTLNLLTVRIDYRDKLVDFSYDPKRIQHCGATSFGTADCF